jgi:hypothetical protein
MIDDEGFRGDRQHADALLLGLTGNPSAPPEVLVRLASADIDVSRLARRLDLPEDAAAVLARDQRTRVRQELAAHPCLPVRAQAVLALDPDDGVRARLAGGEEFFTTVGVHGRLLPAPLDRDVYELLARDPEPKVRRALGFNRGLPDDLRAGLLDDPDPRVAAIAAAEWAEPPVERIEDLLTRATGAFARQLMLLRLNHPLPARLARSMLTDFDTRAQDATRTLVCEIARSAELDDELIARFLAADDTRAGLAANPGLPAAVVEALATDTDNAVRAAVAERHSLDPSLRESIPVQYEDGSSRSVDWVRTAPLTHAEQLALARSRHQILRKSLTLRDDLSDEVIEILARDESFAVRLFICERQPNAPGWLLAQTAATWKSYSRWDMLAHKNFPADAANAIASSPDPHDRVVAAAHPGLTPGLIDTLLGDSDAHVRRRAAANPSIPAPRLLTLLEDNDDNLDTGAAANPALPTSVMHTILEQAGL